MKAIEVKKDLFWVGALDPGLRIFDIIMYTPFGTTYNSYVIRGTKKTAVFETVKERFFDEYLARLKSLDIDVTNIDYIVVNHTEPDHAGSVAKLLDVAKHAKVVGSAVAIRFLKAIANRDFEYIEVKDKDSIDLGGKTLEFIAAPFLHWPDSMYTYIPEDKTLITCDSFGCHYCLDEMFDDKIPKYDDYAEALKYYFDGIMGPFKPFVLRAYDKIKDLDIDLVCPGHGPILRDDPWKVINLYKEWSMPNKNADKNVVICYVSAYGYTKSMAEKISEGIKNTGDYTVELLDVIYNKQEEVMEKIDSSVGVLFGSPTINSDALKPILDLLNIMNPIVHNGKPAGAFGSYGWSGEAVPNIERRLTELRLDVMTPSLKVNFKPSEQEFVSAYKFGENFGKKIAEHLSNAVEPKRKSGTKKWKCLVCGVVFEGSKPPETCPVCGAGKEQFIEITEEEITFASEEKENYVIIGNGAAGFYAADAIRKRNKIAKINIISSEKYRTYFRPELSDYISQDLPDSKLYVADDKWYTDNKIDVTLGLTVKEIKPKTKELILEDNSKINYDKLIIATGSRNFLPTIKGAHLDGVYTLKSMEDAETIKRKIPEIKNAVVIGGGLLGLESAWEMKKAGVNVTVVEFLPRLLPKQLDEVGGKAFEALAEKSGINIILGDSADKIIGTTKVEGVAFKIGKTIPADLVLFSVGIRSNKDLAETCGIKVHNGILVNEKMETSEKDIFAAGDVAEYDHTVFGNWTAAVEMAKIAGANASGDDVRFEGFVSSVIFNALNTSVLSLGEISPEGGKKLEIADESTNTIKTLFFKNDVLKGGYLLGDTSSGGKLILAMQEEKTVNEALAEGLII